MNLEREESTSFFAKKRSKKTLIFWRFWQLPCKFRKRAKVFCFFFSKKKCFLLLPNSP